jgi:hypothetical protein
MSTPGLLLPPGMQVSEQQQELEGLHPCSTERPRLAARCRQGRLHKGGYCQRS